LDVLFNVAGDQFPVEEDRVELKRTPSGRYGVNASAWLALAPPMGDVSKKTGRNLTRRRD